MRRVAADARQGTIGLHLSWRPKIRICRVRNPGLGARTIGSDTTKAATAALRPGRDNAPESRQTTICAASERPPRAPRCSAVAKALTHCRSFPVARKSADVGRLPDPEWPTLPDEILSELERIEFRVNGADARTARIEELMRTDERLRGEIARWVRFVRGGEVAS